MAGRQKIAYNLRFPRASCHLLVGPSGAGKSYRVAKILKYKNDIIEGGEDVRNVVFFYDTWQPLYQQLQDEGIVTRWVHGAPTTETFVEAVEPHKESGGSIVVVDDFEREAASEDLGQIVRVLSRHNNTSTFILFQCLFPRQRHAREISLNVKFIHVLRNPRENAQIIFLARQLSPQSYKWIVDAFHKCTESPFSAFLVDLDQQRENFLRYRSHYLPEEAPMRVWFERGTRMPVFK